jgi:hypothetical protein
MEVTAQRCISIFIAGFLLQNIRYGAIASRLWARARHLWGGPVPLRSWMACIVRQVCKNGATDLHQIDLSLLIEQ